MLGHCYRRSQKAWLQAPGFGGCPRIQTHCIRDRLRYRGCRRIDRPKQTTETPEADTVNPGRKEPRTEAGGRLSGRRSRLDVGSHLKDGGPEATQKE